MELTLSELKPLIKYMIRNNERLQSEGKTPKAIDVISEAGIGKSSIIEQIAYELDYNYVKLPLAMITETGDLCGFPVCLHYACKDDDCKWIAPELIDGYVKAGYHLTGETKMSYALPEWYKNIDPSKGTILLLDDFGRCLPNIIQACYELIYKQEMWSFKLPSRTTVILTNNPDNGDYNITGTDEAFVTRKVNYFVRFDVNSWASWAETYGVDSRAINFMLLHSDELMDSKNTHSHIMNARSYTMFSDVISGIEDWESPESLAMILQIASGCFNDPDNIVGGLFTNFIANKLDKLISPEDMLMQDWKIVKPRIKKCVYNGELYRADIASVLHTRLLNKIINYLKQPKSETKIVEDRLLELIMECDDKDNQLLSPDFIFNIIKTLIKLYPQKCNKFMLNPKFREIIK